jgi:hypothetical protein
MEYEMINIDFFIYCSELSMIGILRLKGRFNRHHSHLNYINCLNYFNLNFHLNNILHHLYPND